MRDSGNARSRGLAGRVALALLAGVLCVEASGCGGSSDPGVPVGVAPLTAEFAPSGTAASQDGLRLTGQPSGDEVVVDVVLRGQTTSSDIYSFAFDLVLGDPDVATYVDGSAVFGTALSLSGSQQSQVLAVQNGGRVTVGVTKLGGGTGNGIGSTDETVVSLTFRLLDAGSTSLRLDGAPPTNATALDSNGAVIGSIRADTADALLRGS